MKRCFDLAVYGSGKTAPNPMVGAVLVHQSQIIGEGYHKKYGGPHAEVNAIKSVVNKNLLPHSTLFVNLEPCCHHGKTPPCTDLIIQSGIRNISISNKDPNVLVSGKGIAQLRKAGCKVETGILEEQGKWLNRRFFTFQRKKRPYIILKWAQSADGFFTKSNKEQHWITGKQCQRLVHCWRSEEDAIMVGTNTVKTDNPKLTNRHWMNEKQPVRIILDRRLQLSKSASVFDNSAQTIVFSNKKKQDEVNIRYIQIDFKKDPLKIMIQHLHKLGILSIIIEGGAILLTEFIKQSLWDEARIFTGNSIFGKGVEAPFIRRDAISDEKIGDDSLKILLNN